MHSNLYNIAILDFKTTSDRSRHCLYHLQLNKPLEGSSLCKCNVSLLLQHGIVDWGITRWNEMTWGGVGWDGMGWVHSMSK